MTKTQVLTPTPWQFSQSQLHPTLPASLLLLVAIFALAPTPIPGQKPILLRDINTTPVTNLASFPAQGVRMGAFLFFTARKLLPNGLNSGTELFKPYR